jgi:hypothetical protein
MDDHYNRPSTEPFVNHSESCKPREPELAFTVEHSGSHTSSPPSTDSGVSFLTVDNLRKLQVQLQVPSLAMPRLKTLRYDSPQYPKALHERGIKFHDLGSPTSPSNYDSIKEAICATRAHGMGEDDAEEAWNVLVDSEAEVEVLGVIAYDILTYRKMRQPKQDL